MPSRAAKRPLAFPHPCVALQRPRHTHTHTPQTSQHTHPTYLPTTSFFKRAMSAAVGTKKVKAIPPPTVPTSIAAREAVSTQSGGENRKGA